MQSIPLDMEDIHREEEGYLSNEEFPPLADELPPLSPTRSGVDLFGDGDNPMITGGDSDADKENQGDKKTRRLVNRKPQPKLDATRLCSDRGLPTLSRHFEKVQFKGKGHEVGDLNRLMSTMEHWAHRLFPKMPFDEVIERVEKLGRKKAVQTCVKKIRMDMPLMDEDFVERNGDEDGDDGKEDGIDDDDILALSQSVGHSSQTTDSPSRLNTSVSLSEEQRERIERNKRLAMERRTHRGPSQPADSQPGLSLDDLRDLERTQAAAGNDEEEREAELWNDIAMFEASQRNVWKKTPEKPTKELERQGKDVADGGAEGPTVARPGAVEKEGGLTATDIVDLTATDFVDLTATDFVDSTASAPDDKDGEENEPAAQPGAVDMEEGLTENRVVDLTENTADSEDIEENEDCRQEALEMESD